MENETADVPYYNERALAKSAGSSRYFTYRERIEAQIKELEMRIVELKKVKEALDKVPETEVLLDSIRKLGF